MPKIGGAFNSLSRTSKGFVDESSRIVGITNGFSRNLHDVTKSEVDVAPPEELQETEVEGFFFHPAMLLPSPRSSHRLLPAGKLVS